MSSEEEHNIAARYRTVRKRLDSLGYKQALSLDALPLIERLLADLIQTTESLKHFKSVAQENIEACSQLQLMIDPYKCDNARLVQECNQLHSDLIETEEAYQKQVKDLKKQIYKLECECNDLQLASSRNLQRIKDLETESSKKSKKILELQGKCLKPVISNVGLATKKRPCYPLRRPVLEADPLPSTGSSSTSVPSRSTVESKVIDLLSMADHRMSSLAHEVTKLKGELSLQTDNICTLQNQLTNKEKEIMRLRKMLEGGRPFNAISKNCFCKKSDKNHVLSHGNENLESNDLKALQQAKLELEQQLKEALNKQHDAMSQAMKLAERNEELEKELRDIDHIALAVEADCNSAVKENNKRVCRLQEKLENVMTQVHVLENELSLERREVQELRANYEACKLEKRNIQRTLERALDEKKQLTDRINQLTIIEKSLNEEIGRLAKENESQKQSVIELQYMNKMLKEQLHTRELAYETDVDSLRKMKEKGEKNNQNKGKKVSSKNTDIRNQKRSPSPRRQEKDANIGESMDTRKEDESEVTQDIDDKVFNDLKRKLIEKDVEIDNLQETIKRLETERNYYKTECNTFRYLNDKNSNKDNVEVWTRTCDLRCQLNEKERTILDLQKEKNELYHDKMKLEAQLEAYNMQKKQPCTPCRSCQSCKQCTSSMRPSSMLPRDEDISVTKAMLDRLEQERNAAKADVQRLIDERDAMHERLKITVESHTSEQHRLKENLIELENRLKQLEKERQDLLITQGTRRATINGLENQLEDMREELKRTKQELTTQRTQYFQLRALQDQTEQALGGVQGQLTESETELNKAIDRNRSLEQQQIQLDSQVKDLKQEINTLHASMAHLDREKDQLLMALDEKTEKIVDLERELMYKEQHVIGMEQQMRDQQHKNEICIDQSAERERQFRCLQLELENLQRQLEVTTADRENAIQENRRLQDDLAATTCEIRNLQRKLESSCAESYDLKRQLQTYVSEVRRAEELLNRKECERTEMLNHFTSLSLEASVLENNNHSLKSEAAEAREALQTARDQLLDLERQLADRDSLIRGYETQISELTQNVASIEIQLRQQIELKQRAESDLTAVRDLCVKLDEQKDSLMQQLEEKDVLKAQYETKLARLKGDQAIIQDQMNKDRATVNRLEELLDHARQESINVQSTNQELQNEISRLKLKITELQDKLSAESTELKQYQNQAAEYSKQIDELRRQVRNERFDRARKEEENRRLLKMENEKDRLSPIDRKNITEASTVRMSSIQTSDGTAEFSNSSWFLRDCQRKAWIDSVDSETQSKEKDCVTCCTNSIMRSMLHVQATLTDVPTRKNLLIRLRSPSISESDNMEQICECKNTEIKEEKDNRSNQTTKHIASIAQKEYTTKKNVNNVIRDIYLKSLTDENVCDGTEYNSNETGRNILSINKFNATGRNTIYKNSTLPMKYRLSQSLPINGYSKPFRKNSYFKDTLRSHCCKNAQADLCSCPLPSTAIKTVRDYQSSFDSAYKYGLTSSKKSNIEDSELTEISDTNFRIGSDDSKSFLTSTKVSSTPLNSAAPISFESTIDSDPNIKEDLKHDSKKCVCELKENEDTKENKTTDTTRSESKTEQKMKKQKGETKIEKMLTDRKMKTQTALVDNNSTQNLKHLALTEQNDFVTINPSNPEFTQVLADIKEHTKNLEQQLTNINDIIKNIVTLSDHKQSLIPQTERFIIFYERNYENVNMSESGESKLKDESNMENNITAKYRQNIVVISMPSEGNMNTPMKENTTPNFQNTIAIQTSENLTEDAPRSKNINFKIDNSKSKEFLQKSRSNSPESINQCVNTDNDMTLPISFSSLKEQTQNVKSLRFCDTNAQSCVKECEECSISTKRDSSPLHRTKSNSFICTQEDCYLSNTINSNLNSVQVDIENRNLKQSKLKSKSEMNTRKKRESFFDRDKNKTPELFSLKDDTTTSSPISPSSWRSTKSIYNSTPQKNVTLPKTHRRSYSPNSMNITTRQRVSLPSKRVNSLDLLLENKNLENKQKSYRNHSNTKDHFYCTIRESSNNELKSTKCVSACTQSSNCQIVAATSFSSVASKSRGTQSDNDTVALKFRRRLTETRTPLKFAHSTAVAKSDGTSDQLETLRISNASSKYGHTDKIGRSSKNKTAKLKNIKILPQFKNKRSSVDPQEFKLENISIINTYTQTR